MIKAFTRFTIVFALLFCYSVFGQTIEPGKLKVGEKVEVEVNADSNKWFPATITEILDDGYTYKVKVAPYGDGKEVSRNIHYKRVRAANSISSGSSKGDDNKTSSGRMVYGKYGCTSSQYNSSTGFYEYTPRGSFVITSGGKYTYYGFEKPSEGTYTVNDKGDLFFKGGYLKDGEATKIDRPNKFFLVFPTINGVDGRWTCGLVEGK